ncbi:MAG: O-antigen ligase family protein [Candidatus Andersenbacteria bacterium]|nr:O-antigen ligase family protein [Candidatus Andersenbacteria bacterium]
MTSALRPYLSILLPSVAVFAIGAAIAATFLGWLGVAIVLGVLVFLAILITTLYSPKIGVFVVAFLLPFEHIGSLDLGGTTVRASQIVFLAVFVGWLLALLFKRVAMRLDHVVYVPMLVFLAIVSLSLIQAENLTRGVTVLVFTVFVMLLPVVLPSVLTTKKDVWTIVVLILLSGGLVSLFGLYQFAGDVVGLPPEVTGLLPQYTKDIFGFPRVHATAAEPLYLANYLLIPIALSLVYFLFRRRTRGELPVSSVRAFLFLSLTGLTLVLTLSRGGYLAFAAVLVLVFLVWLLDGIKTRRLLALCVVGLVAVAGAYGALLFTGKQENLDAFVSQATEFTGGAGVVERVDTYEQAGTLILDHPWLGVGIGNFGPAVASSSWVQPNDGWAIVNNEYLELFAEVGVFGLLAFLVLIGVLVVSGVRSAIHGLVRTREQEDGFLSLTLFAFLAALFGILVQYNTFSTLFVLHIWFVVGMIVVIQRILQDAHTPTSATTARKL